MVGITQYAYMSKNGQVHKDLKTKKINLKIIFPGFLEKPYGKMLLGSYRTNFIKVYRLESCQISGELSVGRKKKQGILNLFRLKKKSAIKSAVFRISTRSKRHSIWYLLFFI